MLQKLIATGIAMSFMQASFSQDTSKKSAITVTGNADVYYKYDFGEGKGNNLTSFTNAHNSFELGMVSAKVSYKAEKVELVADLGFGKRAQEFSYNDEGILAAVKQLYISYNIAKSIKLTAGSWATHVGYEMVDPNLNRNYSMSYMFTNGPFFHTGVKAEAAVGASGFMLGITNPTDFKYVPDGLINNKFLIAQYSFAPGDAFKAFVNYVGGENVDTTKSSQFDLVLTSKLSDQFNISYNGTINRTTKYLGNKLFDDSKTWWGSALYLNYDPSPNLGFTLRGEYFNDDHSLKVYSGHLKGGNVFGTTLSANIKSDHLIFIPEFRIDRGNSNLFTNKKGTSSNTAASFLLAAIYHF